MNDIVANLALLKLYQFYPRHAKDDVILTVLTKALIRFYSADFTCALHLLPPHLLVSEPTSEDSLAAQVQRLFKLYGLLDSARYSDFWALFERDEAYADAVADVAGFEDELRQSIAKTVEVSCRQVAVPVFRSWVHLSENRFVDWISTVLKWTIKDDQVLVPVSSQTMISSKLTITNETVRFEQLSRIVRRAFELEV
jgi:translation initiation factor 3 subunit K